MKKDKESLTTVLRAKVQEVGNAPVEEEPVQVTKVEKEDDDDEFYDRAEQEQFSKKAELHTSEIAEFSQMSYEDVKK